MLRVDVASWRLVLRRKANPGFAKLRARILQRDDHTCQFCGFRSEKFQEIVNRDHNYRNNRSSNMMVACPYCAMSAFLGAATQEGHSFGQVIYLPELGQPDLSQCARVLYCSIERNDERSESAKALLRSLRARTQPVEEIFGEGSADSSVFGCQILDAECDQHINMPHVLKHLRFLPARSAFHRSVQYWSETTYPQASRELESFSKALL